jgi:hypothetical protein
MKLSPDQITILKKLISYRGYPEIDVQYEISGSCGLQGGSTYGKRFKTGT